MRREYLLYNSITNTKFENRLLSFLTFVVFC